MNKYASAVGQPSAEIQTAMYPPASSYMIGSDVYGSSSDWSGPNPRAPSHVAYPAARDESPSTRQRRPSASAAPAMVTTAYVFHASVDETGRCSRMGAGRIR